MTVGGDSVAGGHLDENEYPARNGNPVRDGNPAEDGEPAGDGNPVGDAEFGRLMHGLGPFEPAPALAVACSGGPDSMALLLLSCAWARNAGGSVSALVVDHGLRSDSAAEARQACRWAERAGALPVLLEWRRSAPIANLQAQAREARYRLMAEWCRDAGILHLLVGHHREDQAETLLLRLARGSGVDGLAAMAPMVERAHLRVLRPLLDLPRARLAATLAARGGPLAEDPSNRDVRFARVRMRRLLPTLADEGLSPTRLAATAARMARARSALESRTASVLADSTAFFPEGYALVDPVPLCGAEPEIALRALARIVSVIGGRSGPPRLKRVERLYLRLRAASAGEPFAGRTLGGCRILPWGDGGKRPGGEGFGGKGSGGKGLLVSREPALAGQRLPLPAEAREMHWDGRFRLRCPGGGNGLEIRRLGVEGWSALRRRLPVAVGLPPPVLHALPAVWSLEDVVEAPHLNGVAGNPAGRYVLGASFVPECSLGVRRFANFAPAHHTDRSRVGDRDGN